MPRNAAQLRTDATATGYFNGPLLNYVGDGYSVPWQWFLVVGPAWGGSALAYKAYLDANYLEYSRLHDWLYTPYGPGLIQATQEEADLALREELATQSPFDAEVVYQACSTFGAPWYGVSTVGYVPPPLEPGGHNITVVAPTKGNSMARFKVVMVFQATTSPGASAPTVNYASSARIAGWTESFWVFGKEMAGLLNMLKGPTRTDGTYPPILPARASCLPVNASILGVRIYEGGSGRGTFVAANYPGSTWLVDQPSTSLLCQSVNAGALSARRFTMRAIPDSQVVKGEFSPESAFELQVKTYFDSLALTGFVGRVAAPVFDVFDITSAGLCTLRVNNTFAPGDLVTFHNCITTDGARRGPPEVRVTTVGPTPAQFQTVGWLWGDCTGGTVSKEVKGDITIQKGETSAVRVTNHKVGRPFAGYRGRRSKRRRTV